MSRARATSGSTVWLHAKHGRVEARGFAQAGSAALIRLTGFDAAGTEGAVLVELLGAAVKRTHRARSARLEMRDTDWEIGNQVAYILNCSGIKTIIVNIDEEQRSVPPRGRAPWA